MIALQQANKQQEAKLEAQCALLAEQSDKAMQQSGNLASRVEELEIKLKEKEFSLSIMEDELGGYERFVDCYFFTVISSWFFCGCWIVIKIVAIVFYLF